MTQSTRDPLHFALNTVLQSFYLTKRDKISPSLFAHECVSSVRSRPETGIVLTFRS